MQEPRPPGPRLVRLVEAGQLLAGAIALAVIVLVVLAVR